MKPPPKGWPRISSVLYCDDAPGEIDFLCRAFGFELTLKVEGDPGVIIHSQLTFGDGLVMVTTAGPKGAHPEKTECHSPRVLSGANTQALCVYVDDVDAHCAHARAAGAKIVAEPKTSDYGEEYWVDRGYEAVDPEGHHWYFVQRLSTPGS